MRGRVIVIWYGVTFGLGGYGEELLCSYFGRTQGALHRRGRASRLVLLFVFV